MRPAIRLPYIGEVVSVLVSDTDGANLKGFADEVDMLREDTALLKLPLYPESKDKGFINFTILDNHVDPTAIWQSYTCEDPEWRKVVNYRVPPGSQPVYQQSGDN